MNAQLSPDSTALTASFLAAAHKLPSNGREGVEAYTEVKSVSIAL